MNRFMGGLNNDNNCRQLNYHSYGRPNSLVERTRQRTLRKTVYSQNTVRSEYSQNTVWCVGAFGKLMMAAVAQAGNGLGPEV